MSSSKNLEFEKTGFLSKSNSAFIEQMYLKYINNDPNLPDSWKIYFTEIGDEAEIIVNRSKIKSAKNELNELEKYFSTLPNLISQYSKIISKHIFEQLQTTFKWPIDESYSDTSE